MTEALIIETILQSTIKLSHRTTDKIDSLTIKTDRFIEKISTAKDIFIDRIFVMQEIQNEVKGLQIENRRIMDHIFDEEY